jgi:hypothetical protein
MGGCYSKRDHDSKFVWPGPLINQFSDVHIADTCVLCAFTMALEAHPEFQGVASLTDLLSVCQRNGIYANDNHDGTEFGELIEVIRASEMITGLDMEQGSVGAACGEEIAQAELRKLLKVGPIVVGCYVGFNQDIKEDGISPRLRRGACRCLGNKSLASPAATDNAPGGDTAAAVARGEDVPHAVLVCGIDAKNRVTLRDSYGMDSGGPGTYILPWSRFDASWRYAREEENEEGHGDCEVNRTGNNEREWLQPRPVGKRVRK